MSQHPPQLPPDTQPADDQPLVEFLQAYQPIVPSPNPEQAKQLEAQLFQIIAQHPIAQPMAARRKRKALVAFLGLAGVSLGGFGGLLLWFAPNPSSPQQLAHLEQFLETSWENSGVGDDSEIWLGEQ
jgi:hypothetical protein